MRRNAFRTIVPRADDDKGWWRDLVNRVLSDVLSPSQRSEFDAESYFEAVYAPLRTARRLVSLPRGARSA